MSSSQVRHRTAVVQMCVCVCDICCIVKGLERTAVVQKCVICCVVKDHVLISSKNCACHMRDMLGQSRSSC